MKHRLAVLPILLLLSPSLGAADSAPKLIRDRIEWLDTKVEETERSDLPRGLFIDDSISVG